MSETLLVSVAGFALVLLIAAAVPLLSERLRLPVASLQAALGITLGVLLLLAGGALPRPVEADMTTMLAPLEAVVDALGQLGAQGVLALFLPPLLFDAALRVDSRRLVADLGAVLLLAVVAVVLTTALVAAGVVAVTTMPVLWAVLLGALVATTDPSAVLGAFKAVGAPRRLQALVEGESLLNDAAAIVLFVAVGELLRNGVAPAPDALGMLFAWSFVGGAALGAVIGHAAGLLVARLRAHADTVVTLSVALPYLVFVTAEMALGASGVVAVVLAGLMLGRALEARAPPALESQVLSLWGQLASWAGALIVVSATILIPVTLRPELFDVGALVAVVVGCLVARALVLYGLLPLLGRVGVGERIGQRYRLAMLWGGLRGAVTIALALTVATDVSLASDEGGRVAVLACAFVLFTLFLQAPTLPLLLRWLSLGGLSPLDRLLQARAERAVGRRLADRAAALRAGLGLDVADVEDAVANVDTEPRPRAGKAERRDRILAAIASLTEREAGLYRDYHETGIIGERAAPALQRGTRALNEALRTDGLVAYATAAKRELAYDRWLRFCQWAYRRLRWRGGLARGLALRYELILVRRATLIRLRQDLTEELSALMDETAAARVDTLLAARLEGHQKAIEGLRRQYPRFAQTLETRFLRRATLRLEGEAYRELRDGGLLSGAAYEELRRGMVGRRRAADPLPRLDLRVDRRALLQRVAYFRELDARTRRRLGRALCSGLALPGDRLIRRGELGDSMFFIVDGAVAVQWPGGRRTLGSGDVFGEIALVTGQRRTADVVALTYVQYLVLRREDFERATARAQGVRRDLGALARARREELRARVGVSRETGSDP